MSHGKEKEGNRVQLSSKQKRDRKKKEKWNYGKSKKAAFLKQEFAIIMERYPVMRLVNVLRYNSPSKRQIRRLVGRPKWLNSKNEMDAPMAPEPIKYTSKVNAPFAVFSSVVLFTYR